MKPLATYYKLVDRDTEKVGAKWKVMSCLVLILAVVASGIVSFSFYSLEHAFGDRCVLKANPLLKVSEPKNSTETPKNVLDVLSSKWGLNDDCSFAVFTPLFQCMTGIIWISLFLVCGNGGASNKNSTVPKPYQIVLPVTLYLLAMIILTAYEVPFISDGLLAFCDNFLNQTSHLNESSNGCGSLLDKYSQPEFQMDSSAAVAVYNPSVIPPSWHFYLSIAFIWTTLGAFLLAFLLQIIRCLFVVDFQLIKITIAHQEDEDTRTLNTEDIMTISSSNNSASSPEVLRSNSRGLKSRGRRRGLVVDEHDAKYLSSSSSSLVKPDHVPLMTLSDGDSSPRSVRRDVESKDF
ncbi:uncharacterized protein LOC134833330 isoform X2 [Culicoides brevitarsis]|uniref:uncharacterized protein LOC134833330 isoform X2 n=1 Tax=Culicoides brevitarsis TaxID=469753 RepID=UPI00307C9218